MNLTKILTVSELESSTFFEDPKDNISTKPSLSNKTKPSIPLEQLISNNSKHHHDENINKDIISADDNRSNDLLPPNRSNSLASTPLDANALTVTLSISNKENKKNHPKEHLQTIYLILML